MAGLSRQNDEGQNWLRLSDNATAATAAAAVLLLLLMMVMMMIRACQFSYNAASSQSASPDCRSAHHVRSFLPPPKKIHVYIPRRQSSVRIRLCACYELIRKTVDNFSQSTSSLFT